MGRVLEDATFVRALNEVAREQGMTLGPRHIYGDDAVILLHHAEEPEAMPRVGAVLPVDHRLIGELSQPRHSRVALKRILREDFFSDPVIDDDVMPGDGVRDLRRLGLVGCHVLADLLGPGATRAGIQVTLSPDPACVRVTASLDTRLRLTMERDLIILLRQFHRGARYARAYFAFLRQLETI
ncbi:MAG: hypothetical protein AB7F35_05515 [Acetobacteraceae bacterium]